MATLYTLFNQAQPNLAGTGKKEIPPEELADILLQLVGSAARGVTVSPELVELGAEHEITNQPPSGLQSSVLYYTAPEILMHDAPESRETSLYSIGALLYFMLYGRSYYEVNALWLTDLPEMMTQRKSLIPAGSQTGLAAKYAEIIEAATAWDSKTRLQVPQLVVKLIMQFQSTADIVYQCGGKTVKTEQVKVEKSTLVKAAGYTVTGSDGKEYRLIKELTLFHRPGKYTYKAEVEPVAGAVPQPDPPQPNPQPRQGGSSIKVHIVNRSGRLRCRQLRVSMALGIKLCDYADGRHHENSVPIRSGASQEYVIEWQDTGSSEQHEIGRISIPLTAPGDSLQFRTVCDGLHCTVAVWRKAAGGALEEIPGTRLEADL